MNCGSMHGKKCSSSSSGVWELDGNWRSRPAKISPWLNPAYTVSPSPPALCSRRLTLFSKCLSESHLLCLPEWTNVLTSTEPALHRCTCSGVQLPLCLTFSHILSLCSLYLVSICPSFNAQFQCPLLHYPLYVDINFLISESLQRWIKHQKTA